GWHIRQEHFAKSRRVGFRASPYFGCEPQSLTPFYLSQIDVVATFHNRVLYRFVQRIADAFHVWKRNGNRFYRALPGTSGLERADAQAIGATRFVESNPPPVEQGVEQAEQAGPGIAKC